MYFVIRCNYDNCISKKSNIGFFFELSDAKSCVENLIQDPSRNMVIIAHFDEGLVHYARPTEVYRWSDYYQIYVPVILDDIGRKLLIIY